MKRYNEGKFCTKCQSENLEYFRGFSGWDFFEICQDCDNIDYYTCNDMQASEGIGPLFNFISNGKEAEEEFKLQKKCFELEKAEEGWNITNGGIYAKYDRILHTAKNLLKNEKI